MSVYAVSVADMTTFQQNEPTIFHVSLRPLLSGETVEDKKKWAGTLALLQGEPERIEAMISIIKTRQPDMRFYCRDHNGWKPLKTMSAGAI